MKLAMFAAIVMLSANGLRQGGSLFGGGSGAQAVLGADGAPVSNEESELVETVLKSGVRLVSGQASKTELAKELNDKLYGQRVDPGEMDALGIELVAPKGGAPVQISAGKAPGSPSARKPGDTTDPKLAAKPDGKPGAATAAAQKTAVPATGAASPVAKSLPGPELVSGKSKAALSEISQRMKAYSIELSLIPVVFLGMVLVSKVRRRKREASFVPEFMAALPESDCETHQMSHPVNSLKDEEFELLVAMIYQRKGYRVTLPAGLGGGRSGNFKLTRKSERLFVQCEKMDAEHRVPVDRVRELHDAMTEANGTGGLYVASCGYTWDARHFAKKRNIKLISARTLDDLLTEARATPDEDLLAITPWVSKFMSKVVLTTPLCPTCEAEMEQVKEGHGSVWLCSQRPECRGRRSERKYQKSARTPAQDTGIAAETADAPKPVSESTAPGRRETSVAAGSPPPPTPSRRDIHLPASRPATPKPAPSHAQGEVIARNVDAATTPPIAPGGQGIPSPVAQPATPKPAPSPARGEGATPPTAPKRRGFIIEENQPAKPQPAPGPTREEVTGRSASAGSTAAAAPRRRGFIIEEKQPAPPKPAPSPVRGEGSGKGANAGGTAPVAVRRRGFIIEEKQPATPKPARNLA